jgi:hypothetical protein
VANFQPRKPATQKPRSHHKIATTSPQKTIQKAHVLSKPPPKTPLSPQNKKVTKITVTIHPALLSKAKRKRKLFYI